jgi:hypothetical protein
VIIYNAGGGNPPNKWLVSNTELQAVMAAEPYRGGAGMISR